jgi:LPXTG-motif cell wall-anchored protein
MDTTTIVRIIAGVLAVIVLAIVVYRRKKATV